MTNHNELLDRQIDCECGRTHYVPIKEVNFNFKEEELPLICEKYFSGKKVLIVAHKGTHETTNRIIFDIMNHTSFQVSILEFDDEKLIPDEKAVGRILMTTDRDIDGIISVGSGTINDLNRLIGSRVKIPVVTVATAPSMDGYAASGSSLMYMGIKKTIKGCPVTAILGNVDVIKDCPYELIQAGFGDIIGKRTALTDWVLSREINGEYWCDKTVGLIKESTDLCIRDAQKIKERNINAIKNLIDALVLSGIAMSIVDDTRPASGGEHLVSHYLVMKAIERGEPSPSHGITVGIGTLIITILYKFTLQSHEFKELENSQNIETHVKEYLPEESDVILWLKTIGLSCDVKDYGIDEKLLREIILKAGFIRDRYTVFMLLDSLELLENAADYLNEYFFNR